MDNDQLDDLDGFYAQYARAREVGYQKMADDLLDASDDGANDWMDRQISRDETIRAPDPATAERSKLRVETRRWLLCRHQSSLLVSLVVANC